MGDGKKRDSRETRRVGERLRRRTEQARQQGTRRLILAMLSEGDGAELTEREVSVRLPGKWRGNDRQARYHLTVLRRCGVVARDGSQPTRYRLA